MPPKTMIDREQRRDEKLLHRDRKEKIGSLISTTIATILRIGFRCNITQDNSNEEMMGLNISFLKTCESWNTNGNYQEWHNTTSKDKIGRTAFRYATWRILELLWKESWWTLQEGIKSLMNHHVEPPWRTPVIKEWSNEMKDEKNKVEALQW